MKPGIAAIEEYIDDEDARESMEIMPKQKKNRYGDKNDFHKN